MTAPPSSPTRWRPDRVILGLGVAWLLWMTLPYLAGHLWGRKHGLVYAGFVHNPYDNFTYLAKMWQGYRGSWVYRSPFTELASDGAPLFLFYLALGHVARWLNLGLLTVYHAARLVSGGLLFAALLRTVRAWFPDEVWAQRFGLALSLFGSGLGWLVFPFQPQEVPPDMGIPEAYPYLAVISSPHVTLTLALLVVLIAWPWPGPITRGRKALWVVLAALLSVVYPFGVAVALAALALAGLPGWWRLRRPGRSCALAPRAWPPAWQRGLWIALGGLPYPLYTWWAVRLDPVLAAWNAQNITPSAAWWLMALALSPALPLALGSAWRHWRERGRLPASAQGPAWVWAAASVAWSQVPLALQRRFFVGAYPPAAMAATWGLATWPQARRRRGSLLLLVLSLPSTVLLLSGHIVLMAQGSPVLYLSPAEAQAFAWIREHTPPEAVFLSGLESGARLPAYTGRRTFVGHPLETPNAAAALEWAEAMLCEPGDPQGKAQAVRARGGRYVFIGPRERQMCDGTAHPPAGRVVYRNAEVMIYTLP